MATWRRYLLGGLVASAIRVALPLGIVRDIVGCLIALQDSGGTVMWVLGDGLYGWYQHVVLVEPFPSPADALTSLPTHFSPPGSCCSYQPRHAHGGACGGSGCRPDHHRA